MNKNKAADKKIIVSKILGTELNKENLKSTLETIKSIVSPSDDLTSQALYARFTLKISSLLEESDLPVIRIAFLSNSTLDHWVGCAKFWLLLEGVILKEEILPFGTWRQQILDNDSQLYRFKPDVVWLFLQAGDLRFNNSNCLKNKNLVEDAISDIKEQIITLNKKLSSLVVINNIVPTATRVFGNYEGVTSNSLAMTVAKFNIDIASRLPSGTAVFDIAYLAAKIGLDKWEDARLWHYSKHPFSLDAHGEVAFAGARFLASTRGLSKKCIILDLDNTLWGGVVGDDGVDGILIGSNGGNSGEAFTCFQIWLKALADQGIALAVCSKNNEDLAKEAFLKRKDMVLKLEDFVAFRANWNNKADNIRAIAKELNLGLDSFVFVDDNPAERALVRRELPQVATPELPSDSADYIKAISDGRWFETLAVSNEDLLRTKAYRQNTARNIAQENATDLDSYLQNLEMDAEWGEVDSANIKRVSQLINKTNQFHLTTTRYTEAEISGLQSDSATWLGQFSLKDCFGDHGIIAVVILKFVDQEAFIDTWSMSCRVFSRTMEHFTFNVIQDIALINGCKKIIGKYNKTPKNQVVSDLYDKLGGIKLANEDESSIHWLFDINEKKLKTTTFVRGSI